MNNNWNENKDLNELPGKCKNDWKGYVYVIEHGKKIKIGYTNNLKTRMKALERNARNYGDKTVGKVLYTIPHTNYQENERIMHKHFDDFRKGKTELFTISLSDLIKNLPDLDFKDESAKKEKESIAFAESMKSLVLGEWRHE